MKTVGLYINGQYTLPGAGQDSFRPVIAPDTPQGPPLAQVGWIGPGDSSELIEAALAGAHETFLQIQRGFFPLAERLEFLNRFALQLDREAESLSQVISKEVGKPIRLARLEVQRSIETCTWTLQEAVNVLTPQGLPTATRTSWSPLNAWTQREARGPLLALTPFNFPSNLVLHKVLPALAAGCPVLVKPSPKSALTALVLADIFHAAGLPAGMLSVLNTDNSWVPHLIEDARIAQISFTGSAAVGWALKALTTKPFFLEMGGVAPVYIDASADLHTAVEKTLAGAFSYAGQLCISTQNITLHPEIASAFMKSAEEKLQHWPWGTSGDERTLSSCVIDDLSAQRLTRLMTNAEEHGGRILAQAGEAIAPPEDSKLFLRPRLFSHVPENHPLRTEEAFGPLAHVDILPRWQEWKERIHRSPYRFQAALFTENLSVAHQAAREIRYGAIYINEGTQFRMEPMPFGGHGRSGLGTEGPRYALESYTEIKTIAMRGSAPLE